MKIAGLILLGAFALGAAGQVQAATQLPRLHTTSAATLTATEDAKTKKKVAHNAHKQKVASHKVKKVKKEKKS
jgi:hypothetical protein